MKKVKAQRRIQDMTVFILSCDGFYGLQKRPDKGLLAGLWEFPNMTGKLEIAVAMEKVEKLGIKPKEILRQVEKKHIFTHIEWHMSGIYMEVKEQTPGFAWMSAEKIRQEAALPTAFRQFWEEIGYV